MRGWSGRCRRRRSSRRAARSTLVPWRMARAPLGAEQNGDLWELAKGGMERFWEVLPPAAQQRPLAAEACRHALAGGARDILVLIGDRADTYGPPTDEPIRCDDLVRFH